MPSFTESKTTSAPVDKNEIKNKVVPGIEATLKTSQHRNILRIGVNDPFFKSARVHCSFAPYVVCTSCARVSHLHFDIHYTNKLRSFLLSMCLVPLLRPECTLLHGANFSWQAEICDAPFVLSVCTVQWHPYSVRLLFIFTSLPPDSKAFHFHSCTHKKNPPMCARASERDRE